MHHNVFLVQLMSCKLKLSLCDHPLLSQVNVGCYLNLGPLKSYIGPTLFIAFNAVVFVVQLWVHLFLYFFFNGEGMAISL